MLRMESANQEIDGRPLPPLSDSRANYRAAFGMHTQTRFKKREDIYLPILCSRYDQGLD